MGTQQSSRVKGSKLQQSPSSSTLRNLRFEEPATPFASPPKTSEKSSPQRGKSLWRRGSGETSSPSTARPPSPDIEAQNSRPPSPELVDSSDIDQVVIDDERAMAFFGGGVRHQDTVPARKPSKVSLRSFDSSMGNLAPPRSFDSPCGNAAPSPESQGERHRRSLARGSSQARPRWSRPKAATDKSVSQGRPSDSVMINADQYAAFHPQFLGSEFQLDERDPSIIQAEMLAKASQQKSDDLSGMKALTSEPPPTPSTIMSESGMNCTQSSWNSRPTTSCSTSSSMSRISSVGDGGIDPLDCSRESRMRAHGAHMPSGETLHSLISLKSAWGEEIVDIAEAP